MAPEQVAENIKMHISETFSNREEQESMLWAVKKIISLNGKIKIDMLYEWYTENHDYFDKDTLVNAMTLLPEYFKLYPTVVGKSDELKSYTDSISKGLLETLKKELSCISKKKEPWQMDFNEKYESAMEFLIKYVEEIKNLAKFERDMKWAEMLCGGIQEMFQLNKNISSEEFIAYRDKKKFYG